MCIRDSTNPFALSFAAAVSDPALLWPFGLGAVMSAPPCCPRCRARFEAEGKPQSRWSSRRKETWNFAPRRKGASEPQSH
eukprot:15304797-Alexandrium_andersonii.AAC.1